MAGRGDQRVTTARLGRRFLRTELGRHRSGLSRLAAWTVLDVLPALLSGQLVARALDRGFLAGRPALGMVYLALFGVVYAAAALAIRQTYPTAGRIVEPLRDTLVRLVVDATLRRAVIGRQHPDQAAVARLVQQVETVRDVIAGVLLTVRQVAVTLIATMVGLCTLAPRLLVLVLPPLAASLLVFCGLLVVLTRRHLAMVLAGERIAAAAGPPLDGLRDVVASGAEPTVSRLVGARVDQQFEATAALVRAAALRSGVVAVGAYVPILLVLLAAPGLVRDGMSVGGVVGTIAYLSVNLEPALRALVHGFAGAWLRLTVALGRIMDTSATPVTGSRPIALVPRGHGIEFGIEFDRVTFSYGTADPVVRELDLTIEEGDHLAIVGASGAGKSTLAALIAGTERPQCGELRIGGACLDGPAPAAVVLIPQEAYVFTASLTENLTYLRPDASRAQVGELDRVVELLGLTKLRDRVGGYHAELTPSALSAGERQLIALARAYLSAAPVAVLDEATCHLDPVGEARVEEAFAARPGTLVVIAHRLSSAMRARRVVLIDDGRAVVSTHAGLCASSAFYQEMVRHWAA